MKNYIIPEGWTPIQQPYEGKKLVNVLLSNGEIMAGEDLWSYFDRISREPLTGLTDTKAFVVAWQLIEPLKERARPAYYVDVVPENVELKNLRAIRFIADDSIAAFIWEGKAANLLRDIFEKLHNDKCNDYTFTKADQ